MRANKALTMKILAYVFFASIALPFGYYFIYQSKDVDKTVLFVLAIGAALVVGSKKVVIGIFKRDERTWEAITIILAVVLIPIWVWYAQDYIGLQEAFASIIVPIGFIAYGIIKLISRR